MFREGRGRSHLNVKERAAIVALTEAGKSIREIAGLLNIGEATVVLWQKRHQNTGDVERKPGTGRQRKTTQDQDRKIRMVVIAKPITTAQEIAGIIESFISINNMPIQ